MAPSTMPLVSLRYKVEQMLIRNTERYIRLVNHQANSLALGDVVYNLMYVGVHMPSEHRINGESFPAELQFVHKAAEDGSFLALSVLLDAGDGEIPHPLIQFVIDNSPREIGEAFPIAPFDLSRAMPLDMSSKGAMSVAYPYYTYTGSLTTPPCHDKVRWLVWAKPDYISTEQIEAMENLLSVPSVRPLQPRGQRKVQYRSHFV